jgi:hypothetical protein
MPVSSEELFYLSCDMKGEECEGFFKTVKGFTLKFWNVELLIANAQESGWRLIDKKDELSLKFACPKCYETLTKSFQNATLEEDKQNA